MEEKLIKKYLPKEKQEDALFRLKQGEPVQYIIGNVEFCGYEIKVNRNVLIPRFETEELVENTLKYLKKYNLKNVLEIGTGSGCISIALKKEYPIADITATDISLDALEVAKQNAKLNDVKINFINTNIFDNVEGRFDCIISNPPYISFDEKIMDIVYNNEPHIALFAKDNGLYFYKQILSTVSKILSDKYLIAFEIGHKQASDIKSLADFYLNNAKVEVKKDLSNRDRMIFIHNFE